MGVWIGRVGENADFKRSSQTEDNFRSQSRFGVGIWIERMGKIRILNDIVELEASGKTAKHERLNVSSQTEIFRNVLDRRDGKMCSFESKRRQTYGF